MNVYPQNITKRFWVQILRECHILAKKRWADLSKIEFNRLIKIDLTVAMNVDMMSYIHMKEKNHDCLYRIQDHNGLRRDVDIWECR